MLVLSRRIGERIMLLNAEGEVIATVVLTDLRGDKARIGIEADRSMRIIRPEVHGDPLVAATE